MTEPATPTWHATNQYWVMATHPDGWRIARHLGVQRAGDWKSPALQHSILFRGAAVSTTVEPLGLLTDDEGEVIWYQEPPVAVEQAVEAAYRCDAAQDAELERVRTMFEPDGRADTFHQALQDDVARQH